MQEFDLQAFSPYVANAQHDPLLAPLIAAAIKAPLQTAFLQQIFDQLHPGGNNADPDTIAIALRRLRRVVISALALHDLQQQAPLQDIEQAMTTLAQFALAKLLPALSAQVFSRTGQPRTPNGQPLDLLVIGMGKLGAEELNVSSDIDVVYALPEYGHAGDTDALEIFGQIAQQLTRTLQQTTADGFIFRVDTRLRPFGEVGPQVVSLGALEHYFMAHGRFWERCAWLKARIVNMPIYMDGPAFAQAQQRLAQSIHSFVYKRYTDYTTLEGLADLAARIRTQRDAARRDSKFGGMDVKLSRGGIREVELLVQGLAIMHGGRQPALRVAPTRLLLQRLAAAQRLPQDVATRLDAHYVLLRRIEHALQYREDAQTHTIPQDDDARTQLAYALRFTSLAQFDETLANTKRDVAAQFDAFLPAPAQATSIAQPAKTAPRIATWLSSVARESEATQQRFERVLQQFDAQLPEDENFARAARFVQAIARRRTYLDLLLTHPAVVQRVAQLMAASPFATDYLTQHPILLDELIDARTSAEAADWHSFDSELAEQLQQHQDTEQRMNILRELHHAQVLRILARDLAGGMAVETVSDELSLLADKLLAAALHCAWHVLAPDQPLPPFAIIAYGRLGAKEMGYASDLDLVFLFDGPADTLEQPTRLAQRLTTWLSAITTSGRLFEVDLRLRPNGNAGLLVTTTSAFARYQYSAALWEHQALSRARFVAGNMQIGAWFEQQRNQLLATPRQWQAVAQEVSAMRKRVLEGHPNNTEQFDLKHDPGGLVDMEFAVQALVLAHAAQHPELLANKGTLALAGLAADAGLADPALTHAAQTGYRTLRGLQHARRLAGDVVGRVAPASVQQERAVIQTFVQSLALNFPRSRT
jgi:[glutamine synthetase] adenylyltransferase / [glutamine synthetase]-adenylyl-L-tyrosine phosphorylase